MPILKRGFNNRQWRSIQGPTRLPTFHDSAMRVPVEVDRFKKHQVSPARESFQPTPLGRGGLERDRQSQSGDAVGHGVGDSGLRSAQETPR